MLQREATFLTGRAEEKVVLPPMEPWALLAIEEELEHRVHYRAAAAQDMTSLWSEFVGSLSPEQRNEFRSRLGASKAPLFDLLEAKSRSDGRLLKGFRDPMGKEERETLRTAAKLDNTTGPDPTFDECREIGDALVLRNTWARVGRQIDHARRHARERARDGQAGSSDGRPPGSADPVRRRFYLGVAAQFAMNAYGQPKALDLAEIAMVRGYTKTKEDSWKKWLAAHRGDPQIQTGLELLSRMRGSGS